MGSCALYRGPAVAITAGHCVPEGVPVAVKPRTAEAWIPERIVRHDKADIAVLVAPAGTVSGPDVSYYDDIDETLVAGGDFIAFGHPAEGDTSVPRIFKGHFQRYLEYRGYFAGELSVPAPAGLSGGPISRPESPGVLAAIVTTNHDSYLVTDSYETQERDGSVSRGEIKRVVSYGIAAMLVGLGDWINEAAGPRS